MIPVIDDLIHALARLPGLGTRSAERAALALLRTPEVLSDPLVDALQAARREVRCCSVCGGFTSLDQPACALCQDALRDDTMLCVVEEPSDIYAIERSGGFRGRYHALMGKLSPSHHTGASELRIQDLIRRVEQGGFQEVLLALSTDLEGDATAGYLAEQLQRFPVTVSRLAFGLPADSGVRYSDPLTLKRAIAGRIRQGG